MWVKETKPTPNQHQGVTQLSSLFSRDVPVISPIAFIIKSPASQMIWGKTWKPPVIHSGLPSVKVGYANDPAQRTKQTNKKKTQQKKPMPTSGLTVNFWYDHNHLWVQQFQQYLKSDSYCLWIIWMSRQAGAIRIRKTIHL